MNNIELEKFILTKLIEQIDAFKNENNQSIDVNNFVLTVFKKINEDKKGEKK
jgi:hypothetical protein